MFEITDTEKLRDAYTLLAFIRDDVPAATAEQAYMTPATPGANNASAICMVSPPYFRPVRAGPGVLHLDRSGPCACRWP